jgi:hypothetical protein
MKRNILSIAAVLILAVACKKNNSDDPVPQPPVTVSPAVGYWTGKYTTTGQLGFDKFAMLYKADGLLRVYEMGDKTDTAELSPLAKVNGVWSMSGNSVQTTYYTSTKTINTTATLNAAKTQMAGTWAFDAAVKGNIELTKQN